MSFDGTSDALICNNLKALHCISFSFYFSTSLSQNLCSVGRWPRTYCSTYASSSFNSKRRYASYSSFPNSFGSCRAMSYISQNWWINRCPLPFNVADSVDNKNALKLSRGVRTDPSCLAISFSTIKTTIFYHSDKYCKYLYDTDPIFWCHQQP